MDRQISTKCTQWNSFYRIFQRNVNEKIESDFIFHFVLKFHIIERALLMYIQRPCFSSEFGKKLMLTCSCIHVFVNAAENGTFSRMFYIYDACHACLSVSEETWTEH